MLNEVLEKGLANRARVALGDGAQSLFQFLSAAEGLTLHQVHEGARFFGLGAMLAQQPH